MDKHQTDTKGRILEAAYRLFYRQGFSRASVDEIAANAGVTKRSVYYHFDSKDQIIAAVMEVQHLHLMSQYADWLEPSANNASEMIDSLFSKLRAWADGPNWMGSGFSRITAELADMPGHPARHVASKHKAAVEKWLAERFRAAGVYQADQLASQTILLIEGSMSLALIHGDTNYIGSAMVAAKCLANATEP